MSDRPPPNLPATSAPTENEEPTTEVHEPVAAAVGLVSPVDVRPFPKAHARKTKSGGRKRGRTQILTATPVKEDEASTLETTPASRRRKLFDDDVSVQANSETETDQEYHSESEDSGGDFVEEAIQSDDDDDSEDEVNVEDLREGLFVIVMEGIGKGGYEVFSVGKITELTEKSVTVQYFQLRKCAFVKTDNCYVWDKKQILKILPSPKRGTTKRSSSLFYFQYDFSKYGLKA